MTDDPANGNEPADNDTPFERFERLTKALVQVPKSEIDAAREKAKKSSAKRRPARPRS